MFTWITKQSVKSSDGFELATVERFRKQYSEGTKVITFFADVGSVGGVYTFDVAKNAFEKWDGGESITKEKQKIIRQNVADALEFQGLALERRFED